MALILPFGGVVPQIHPSAFVAPNATVIGNVVIGPEASIWFGAVLRGDSGEHEIRVGRRTSVQDNCVVHVGSWGPTVIGADVTVGHGAKFESCTIGDRCVIGMNAIILQNATIGPECVVAANSVVLEGATIPERSLVAGIPATIKKTLDGSAARWVERGGQHYVDLSRRYLAEGVGGHDPLPSRCDLCGGVLIDRHCKLVCATCGYQRDCSDP